MTPYEMEEQLKNLDARTTAIEHVLPTLATKEDLRLSTEALQNDLRLTTEALQDDLRLTTEALQHEIETGFQEAKAHADRLNTITREQIRLLAEQMATKGDMAAMKDDLHGEIRLVAQQMATKGDLQDLRRELSKQFAALRAPGAKRR